MLANQCESWCRIHTQPRLLAVRLPSLLEVAGICGILRGCALGNTMDALKCWEKPASLFYSKKISKIAIFYAIIRINLMNWHVTKPSNHPLSL